MSLKSNIHTFLYPSELVSVQSFCGNIISKQNSSIFGVYFFYNLVRILDSLDFLGDFTFLDNLYTTAGWMFVDMTGQVS